MPYPNEHAARINDPGKYEKIRRVNDKFGSGIDALFGIGKDGKSEVQAIRFNKKKFTAEEAKKWLSEHDYKTSEFSEASRQDSADIEEVIRYDRSSMGKTYKTDDGFLRSDAVITRTGIFKYKNPDGSTRRELRLPEEVFKEDSVDSMKMIPIVNNHPFLETHDESDKLITTANVSKFQVGYTGENIRRDGENVRSTLTITDPKAIEAVEKQGRNKLSLGYKTDLVMESGTYNGDAYDCIQTNIRNNHLALVDIPRAGMVAAIEFDSADVNEDFIQPTHKEAVMPKVNLDGIDYEAAPEVINALAKAKQTVADLTVKNDGLNKETDKVRADSDTLRAENETLKKRDISTEIVAGVKGRLALERSAAICLDGEDVSSLSDAEIRVKVIAKQFPEIKLDGKSVDYVNGCFDNAVAIITKNKEDAGIRDQRRQSGSESVNNDGKDSDPDKARDRYIARLKNGGKAPEKK